MDRYNLPGNSARRQCKGGAPRCQHTLAVLLATGSEFCPQCLSETLSGPGLATHKIISARFFLDTLRSEPDLCRLVAAESHYLLAAPLVQALACSRDEELAATLADLVVFLVSKGSGRGARNDASGSDEGLLLENLVRAVAVEMDKIPVASSSSGHCFLLVLLGKLLTVACNRYSALPAWLAQQNGLWSHVVSTLHKQAQDSIRAESLFVLHKLCSLPGGMQLLEEKLPGMVCAGIALLLSTDSNDVSANCVALLTALSAPSHPAFTLSSLARLDHPEAQQPGGATMHGLGSQGCVAVGSQNPRASQAMHTQGKAPLGLRMMLCEGLKKTLLAADSALQLAALHLISQLALSCAPSHDGSGSDERSRFDWVAREAWEVDWCKQDDMRGGDGGGMVDERGAAALQAMLDEGLAEHVFELLRSADSGLVPDPLLPAALSCLLHLAASPGAAGQAFARRFVFGFDTLTSLLHNAIEANDFHLQALSISVFLHALRSARATPRDASQFPPARLHGLVSALAGVVRRFCVDVRERKRWVLDQNEAFSTACFGLAVLATWQSIVGTENMQLLRLLEQCVGDGASILPALQDVPSTGGSLTGTGAKLHGASSAALPAAACGAAGGTDEVAVAVLTFLHACAQRFLHAQATTAAAAALASSQQDAGLLAMVGGSQGVPMFHSSQQEGVGRGSANLGRTGGTYTRGKADKTQDWGAKAPSVSPSHTPTALQCCIDDIAAALMAAADMHVAPFMFSLHPQLQPPPGHMHAPQSAASPPPFSDPAAILSCAYDVLSHMLACPLPSLAPIARQFAAKLASSWTLSLIFSSLQAFHPPTASSRAAPSWRPQSVAPPQASEGSKWDVLRRASLRFAVLLSTVAATGEEGQAVVQWVVGVAGVERMPWAVSDMVLLLAQGRGEPDAGRLARDMQWRYQGGESREGSAGEEEEVQAVQWVVLLILYAAVQFDDRLVDYEDMFGALQSLVLSNRIPPLGSPLLPLPSLTPSPHNHQSDAHSPPPPTATRSTFFLLVFLSLHALLRPCCSTVSFDAQHRLLCFLHRHATALSFPLTAWHLALPHWILLQDGPSPGTSNAAVAASGSGGGSLRNVGESSGAGACAAGGETPELDALGSLLSGGSESSNASSNGVDEMSGDKEEAGRRCARVVAGVVREMWRARGEWQQLAQVTEALAVLVDRHPHLSARLEQGALSTMYIEAMLLSGSNLPPPLLLATLHLLARLLSHLPPKPPVPPRMGGRLQSPPQQATAWERLAQQVLIVVEPLVESTAVSSTVNAAPPTPSQQEQPQHQQQQQQHYSQAYRQAQVHCGDGGAGSEQEERGEREQVLVGALSVINALLWHATTLYTSSGAEPCSQPNGGARSGGSRTVGDARLMAVVEANEDVVNAAGTIMMSSALVAFTEGCVRAAACGICGTTGDLEDTPAVAGGGTQGGGCGVGVVQARGSGGVWQGYSCRVLLSCLTFFNLRVSWYVRPYPLHPTTNDACTTLTAGTHNHALPAACPNCLSSLHRVHALEAASILPSGIPPLNLSLRFSPPSQQPAAAPATLSAAADESATIPAAGCASQGDPAAPMRQAQQQERPSALSLASACDLAAILLAAAAGQLPATVPAHSREQRVGGAAGPGCPPGNSSGCGKADGDERKGTESRSWAGRAGGRCGHASMQDSLVAADLASCALLSCLSSLALPAHASSVQPPAVTLDQGGSGTFAWPAVPPLLPAPGSTPGESNLRLSQQEQQERQNDVPSSQPSPQTPSSPVPPAALPSLSPTVFWPIAAALQHAASCPHPPVRRNTCLALSLLLRCFDPASVALPLAASPWTRLLLDDALASITAAAAATAAGPSSAAVTAVAPDAAAVRAGEGRPAGEAVQAQSTSCPSPALLDLLLSHSLEALHIAASCFHLAPPTAPPRWLSQIFQPARVSALLGSLWRTRQLSLPAIATCHRLIGAGLLPRSVLPQLLDLVQQCAAFLALHAKLPRCTQ
ncbi:unnamed protein product [Closterium sp. NIES-65]|nr:unnamed protein product [Closterium sp. NIES-65]